jgi:hypothetical protein
MILAFLLCCAALAVFFLTSPVLEDDPQEIYGTKLSALSGEECIAFVQECGIGLPPGVTEENLGSYLQSIIANIEAYPYITIVGAENVVVYNEQLRLAVIRHEGIPWLPAGVYAFDENLYTTPVSSYIPFDGTGLLYCVGEDFFVTADEKTHEVRSAASFSFWKVREVAADVWVDEEYPLPPEIDLNKYSTRLMFTGEGMELNTALYLMDGEVWLVKGGDRDGPIPVWSIYKLKLTDLPLDGFAPES